MSEMSANKPLKLDDVSGELVVKGYYIGNLVEVEWYPYDAPETASHLVYAGEVLLLAKKLATRGKYVRVWFAHRGLPARGYWVRG